MLHALSKPSLLLHDFLELFNEYMSDPTPSHNPKNSDKKTTEFVSLKIPGFEQLAELALDMSWSWNHASDSLWRALDPELWELTHNPWALLQTVSYTQIETLLKNPLYREEVDRLLEIQRQAANAPAWFQQHHSEHALKCVAYFSMEFMLSEALPIYSGGLGNVAGDQL